MRNSITTGSRVGSAQYNPNDEKQVQSRIAFDPITLVCAPFDVWDAPIAVRGFRLTTGVFAVVQISAGCNEGDEFEDLYINGRRVQLWEQQKLLVITVDGRYRLRLEGAVADAVRILQYRTNQWSMFDDLFIPAAPRVVHIPLFDTFNVRLGDIDPPGGDG